MTTTNHDRVGTALDLLRQGLAPYIEREMRAAWVGGGEVKETPVQGRLP